MQPRIPGSSKIMEFGDGGKSNDRAFSAQAHSASPVSFGSFLCTKKRTGGSYPGTPHTWCETVPPQAISERWKIGVKSKRDRTKSVPIGPDPMTIKEIWRLGGRKCCMGNKP